MREMNVSGLVMYCDLGNGLGLYRESGKGAKNWLYGVAEEAS